MKTVYYTAIHYFIKDGTNQLFYTLRDERLFNQNWCAETANVTKYRQAAIQQLYAFCKEKHIKGEILHFYQFSYVPVYILDLLVHRSLPNR